jgi:acyl-CoA thioesterase FadM
MTDLELLLTTEVTADQIDHLGHMNVRYYAQHARSGAFALAEKLGAASEGPPVEQQDLYVRHHHEQLKGSQLAVHGGVLGSDPRGLHIYEELTNAETRELAATFVITLSGQGSEPASTIDIPPHGRPRSIDLDDDPVAHAPALDELRDRQLEMRQPRVLEGWVCDDDGLFPPGALPELVWGGIPVAGRGFEPFHDADDGTRLGWASMETRSSWGRIPSAGTRVQSFGAEVDLQDKTTRSRHWVFDLDNGELLGIFSVVNLAFDVDARKAASIPDALRAKLEHKLHRDLDH